MTPIERARARQDALDTLGVGAHASNKELRAAWKARVRQSHPDQHAGDDTEYRAARAAYEYLAGESDSFDRPAAEPKPQAARSAHHRRVRVKTRMLDLAEDSDALARALEENDTAPAADHVPQTVRRRGRRLTYIIKAPLQEGANRVAIPSGALGGASGQAPQVVTFNSPKAGPGKVVLPDEIRESLLPGSRQVRIQFEAC